MNNTQHDICKKYLLKQKADAMILITALNRYWYSSIKSSEGYIVITKNNSYLLVDDRYYNGMKNNKTINVIRCNSFNEFKDFIKQIKPKINNILIENSLTLKEVENYIDPLKIKYDVVNSQELRIVKTPNEIKLLQKAADIAVDTINYIKKTIKVGMTEKQVAKLIYIHMIELGAECLSFPSIVASGKNSAIPHHSPSDKKIAKNEFITVDIGCVYQGYCSDITRTFVIGKPTKRMQDMYELVLKSQSTGVDKIRANMKGSEVDAICRNIISQNPIWKNMFIHGTGHGVGLEIHELPNNKPTYNGTLFENSIVTIEPGVYEPNYYGVRIEDTVVVKKGKCVVLTKKANKIISI